MENCVMNGEDDEQYKLFLSVHTPALKAARIPPLYWRRLSIKLAHEVNTRTLMCFITFMGTYLIITVDHLYYI